MALIEFQCTFHISTGGGQGGFPGSVVMLNYYSKGRFFLWEFFLQNVHKMHQFLNSVLSSFPICLIPKNVHFCKITIKMQQSLFGLNQMQKSKTFIFLYFYIYMKIIIYRKVRLTCKIIKAILSDLEIANRIAVLSWE